MKVISYSLYNKRQKDVLNAVINCMLAEKVYPGWICRFYIDNTIPPEIEKVLLTFSNVEIIKMEDHKGSEAMLWRFFPCSDDNVEVMISRDADSWLNEREKVCVDEWLTSDKSFHIIRDHCYHSQKMMGGMWGAKKGAASDMRDLAEKFMKDNTYDQGFLAEFIYPRAVHDSMIHTSPQWNNQNEFLGSGYFNDGIMSIPTYEEKDEVIEGFSFREVNLLNSFHCSHCRKSHDLLIGGICEKIPSRSIDVLRNYFRLHDIKTDLL